MKKFNLENALDQFESLSEIEAMEKVNGGCSVKKPTPIEPPIRLFYGIGPRFDIAKSDEIK